MSGPLNGFGGVARYGNIEIPSISVGSRPLSAIALRQAWTANAPSVIPVSRPSSESPTPVMATWLLN
jgi:hypothetical protein